ncbi:2-hydroxyacid dehydrogenase [Rhodococcoides trifolii]|uniref:2-hydroxyacid dehydrogenase n=1 Tax=Rhodococcoides trifolii TaxID=908250 RepID=A0A917CYA3_9NOCA|nr:D-2-hydroxyacid dehydrogenase [Rhodococcus trifolii]GGG02612.1 2-hydroxyacid dehydrogenase [Rhodococcus trifolii]
MILTVLQEGELPPRLRSVEARHATSANLAEVVEGSDALLLWDSYHGVLETVFDRCDALRWVHVAAAGVDAVLFRELRDSDVTVTNSRGVFDRPIAEFVLGSVLSMAKDTLTSVALTRRREWRHRETDRIDGSSALVVGTGSIGRAIAKMLSAVGMNVAGVGRSERTDPDFGTVHASSSLVDVVGAFDYLILVAPLTAGTRGLVGAEVLAATRPGVRIVNVGRGELLDTSALVDGLRRGHIAAAALDVFETEPLPSDHPLWELPNVLLTPHMSGDVRGWQDRMAEVFLANLTRYRAGDELVNVVDKGLGFVPG